ncbi:MAG: hypothetical protein KJ995_08165 [Candidatus Omnitrophica bacterium]|nr:hypothetical protein [Candidatus Omnitrophota bacterium]MBU1852361.1 hypothetical protein [Candidatus Omnitrophota bacterium]
MKTKLLYIALICILSINQLAYALQDTEEGRKYLEALVNLKRIESYFTEEPIYLNKNEKFKSNLRKKIAKIINCIKDYQKTDPENPEVLFYLGKTYSYAHDLDIPGAWQNSVKYFNKLIEMQPENTMARLLQAKNYMDNQEYDKALGEYEYVNKLEPHGQALRFMAIAKMYLKRKNEAKNDLSEYIKYNPNDVYAKKLLNAIESEKIQYD